MKILFNIVKFFTGALFVFSGMVKLNDPSGFSIKLNEYFDVFAEDLSPKQDSVQIAFFADSQLFFQEKFVLYPSDKEKNVALHLLGDSSSGLRADIRYGGMERRIEADSIQGFPKQIQVVLTPPNRLNADTQSFVQNERVLLDSQEINSQEVERNWTFDVGSYIKPPNASSTFFKEIKSYSLYMSVFFCALEVLLGLAMLLGYEIKITVVITALLIAFFTFLTGYSAYYNKVTDCGCFGDFLKLEPWQSFKKDLVLSVLVLIMIGSWKHNNPVFKAKVAHKVMAALTVLTFGFGWFCYMYLPVWDFLPYKVGNNIQKIMEHIPAGERASDSIQIRFVMQKGQDSVKVTTLEYADYADKGYTFVRQDRQIIIEGYKSPIHDFAIYNLATGEDLKDRFLQSKNYQMVFIMPFLSEANTSSLEQIKMLYELGKQQGWDFYALSSASLEPSLAFIKKHQLPFEMYAADQKMLMTMARYNPTLYIFKGSTVLAKYSGNNLPVFSEILALTQGMVLYED